MNSPLMPIPVKKSPRSHDGFVTYILHIASCLTNNAPFAGCNPSPPQLEMEAKDLAAANAKAKGGGPGVVADRDAKHKHLEGNLDHVVDYVKGVVTTQAPDSPTAATWILSTGLSIRKIPSVLKPPLLARHGQASGEIRLAARAVAPAAVYFWESSQDQITWSVLPVTMHAKTVVTGLTPGQVYSFRFRAHTRKGMSAYTDAVKLMAL
ncbi:MAG: fibronectin type III domain-containing protein [Byssovorax sp.]